MRRDERIVDLRNSAPVSLQAEAYGALRGLRRGESAVLLMQEHPGLTMKSLDIGLRHKFAWTIVEEQAGWRVDVRHIVDSVPRDVMELLSGAHQHLDALMVEVLRLVNSGEIGAAAPVLRQFSGVLRRHIRAEDELLTPFFRSPHAPAEPIEIMLREHREIMQQLGVIDETLAADEPDAAELGAFCAILSGSLAKHEHREETNVFSVWRSAWTKKSPDERDGMMKKLVIALADDAA
jgi:hemerythrin-like domain-containing protein